MLRFFDKIIDTSFCGKLSFITILRKITSNQDEKQIPSSCTRGFYGIKPVLLDENGDEITENEVKGIVVIAYHDSINCYKK